MNGMDNPTTFILEMLQTETDHSTSSKIEPKDLPETAEQKATAKAKTESTVSLSPQELAHSDRLYRPGTVYELNNPKAGVSLKATAT